MDLTETRKYNIMNESELEISWFRGQGKGGQNRNKLENACRIRHIPTGLQAEADARDRRESKRNALKAIRQKVKDHYAEKKAAKKKARRDEVIQPGAVPTIRTYDYSRGIVKDHRTGKTASIKNVLGKGRIDLLYDEKTTSLRTTS